MRPLLLELTCLKRSIYGTRTRRSNRSVPMCNCAGWACHGHALNGRVGDDAEAGRGVCVATESDKKRARKTRCRWTLSRSDGWPLQGLIVKCAASLFHAVTTPFHVFFRNYIFTKLRSQGDDVNHHSIYVDDSACTDVGHVQRVAMQCATRYETILQSWHSLYRAGIDQLR